MKTSASQFDIMITYMEMNGDLSRPTGSAMGRARTIRQWEELRSMLNADPTGDPKPAEKWKKVWSDFKLNTKKKAARINRAISGTGGGPGVGIHLSAAEERVLKIIGPQAATGITTVVEAGLQLMELAEPDPTVAPSPPLPQLINTVSDETYCSDTQESQNCTNVFYELADASLCAGTVSDMAAPAGIAGPGETTDPGDAANLTDAASPANAANLIDAASPANAASPADVASSANGTGAARRRRLIMTPQRRMQRRGRPTRSPRRRLNANEEAAQHFLNADAAYRQFERERAIREEQRELRQMAMRERELEIRERELALTARWQEIADRLLDIANEYVSRI